jgi:predicted F0F1-ATPase subunit
MKKTRDSLDKTTSRKRYTLRIGQGDRIILSERQENSKKKKKEDVWFYLGFAGEIGYVIALPIVGGALIGGYIDRHISTYPRATLLLLFAGIGISFLGFIRTIQMLIQKKN